MNFRNFRYFFLGLVGLVAIASSLLAESPWDSLNSNQQKQLVEGKLVFLTETLPAHPWPRFVVYKMVKASPLQAAAVFWDVEYQDRFIPDCLKVSITDRRARNIVVANYEIRMPILSNEISSVSNRVTVTSQGGYKISWEVLKSKYSKSGSGSFEALPMQQGTLLCYKNLVVPGSSIAALLRGPAENQVKVTVAALAAQIEKESKGSNELLTGQIKQLQEAL